MADQWIDVDYVDARMGSNARQALTSEQSVDLTAFIETATALVQGICRASGYTTPATTTCELCRGATYAVMCELLYDAPDNGLTKPEGWETSIHRMPLKWLEEGTAHPSLALASTGAAIGGWTVSAASASSDSIVTSTDINDRLPRATRRSLWGY